MDRTLFFYNANQTCLNKRSRAIAYAVLVEGESQRSQARRYGLSQPRVAAIVKAIREPAIASGTPRRPPGWVYVGARVPSEMAALLRMHMRTARQTQVAEARKAAKLEAEREPGPDFESSYSGSEIVSPDDW